MMNALDIRGQPEDLSSSLGASTHPVQSCFCAWGCASGVGWMLLQEDVHSLLTPLFLLPRCLQTLPVCAVSSLAEDCFFI